MTANGFFNKPRSVLAELLANCASFQAFTGSADAAEALERIYIYEEQFDAEDESKWPFAVITFMDGNWSATRSAVNAGIANYEIAPQLTLVFEQISTGNSQEDFENTVSDIIQDMMILSEPANNYMQLNTISLDGIVHDKDEAPPVFVAKFAIQYGF